MANAREIKNRIKSIEDTKKITNAMYMISTTKLRKTKRELEMTRPFFDTLQRSISRIFYNTPDVNVSSRYFMSDDYTGENVKKTGCLVVTSDKGLAGAYNHNILKLATEYLNAQKYLTHREKTQLFIVGEYGRQYCHQKKIPIEQSFLYSAQNPSMQRAREIADVLLGLYDSGELDEIHIIYTDMNNGISTEVKTYRLLPLDKTMFISENERVEYKSQEVEFIPSVTDVLDAMVPSYVIGFIYSALVASFCSEQNARMLAMDSAGRNADEMLQSLSVQYNRVRQASITQEITEVAAGAKSQKRMKNSQRKEA